MMDLLKPITQLKAFTDLKTRVESKECCAVFGVDRQKPYFIAELVQQTQRRYFIVTPDDNTAKTVNDILNACAVNSKLFPSKDYNFRNIESVSRFDENARLDTISHIRKKDFSAIVIPAPALCALVMSSEDFREKQFYNGDTVDFESFIKIMPEYGYEFYSTVEGPGQYSVRGGIVDVFPPGEKYPYRVEFFGDEIDSISLFDVATQRRTEPMDAITIPPAKEYDSQVSERLIQSLQQFPDNSYAAQDLELVQNGILPKHDRYLPLYYQKEACILDYMTSEDTLVFFDSRACIENIAGRTALLAQDIGQLVDEGYPFIDRRYYFDLKYLLSYTSSAILFETFPCSLPEFRPKQLIEVQIFPTSVSTMFALKEEIADLLKTGYTVTVLANGPEHEKNLRQEFGMRPGLSVCSGALPYGFLLPQVKAALYTYSKSAAKKRTYKSRYDRGERIKSFADLEIGDYVVHRNYGIAVYDGIHKVDSQGIVNDYIRLKFAGTDVLYVPCSQLDQISKYISGSSSDMHVKLNRLGGTDWFKTKQKVRSSVRDLAKKLIALYGARLQIQGHAFSPDTEWQKDFEAHFEYEETEDQLRSIEEIKHDMEQATPMDRLLCGDVGFGKTEVAIRAIFKCVMDGLQVAVLAPTTILAFQHYQTMIGRFGEYPVRVELLSRFRTAKQQKEILEKLKQGKIDVIVGTHRLVQKDVVFKKLGLIIIDEEQRFGVAHKEFLKESAKTADVLTLSATPIPRTLNMSMSGIRDISMLSEAPHNRLPVVTYVAEYDLGLILDAIRREVSRGGQCFYLHNRVDSIYKTADLLRQKTGYRIQVAHGKMSQEELSEIWNDLIQGEIDVLVCTTIIETGVDVPNCNTLIIEDADRLGLAQLHQIRGRVGRSTKRAYAYFTFRKGKTLSPEAYKRLMTIKEFTEFGSGLKIAMRDLEIRGAGDILGAEQSGHLMTVGFDMYMKLLEEAVVEEKGEQPTQTECTVELKINAYIPDDYIKDAKTRIEMYKAISSIESQEDYSDVLDELIDRFSTPPSPVMSLLDIAEIRMTAAKCGVGKIEQKEHSAIIYFENQPSWDVIAAISAEYRRKLLFSAEEKPYFTLKTENIVVELKQFLNKFRKIMDTDDK